MRLDNIKIYATTSQQRTAQRGIALIELLVSLVLFAIFIVGLTQMQKRSVTTSIDSHQRSHALWQVNALIDTIIANNSAAALNEYQNQIATLSTGTCPASPSSQCQARLGDSGASECNVSEMAQFDVWNAFCASESGLDTSLVDYSANLTCTGPCVPGSNMTLMMSWISKANDSDSELRTARVTTDGVALAANIDFVSMDFRP